MKARRRTGPTDTVKALVHNRDGGTHVRCGTRDHLTIHHRVNRSTGGAREGVDQPGAQPAARLHGCNGWFEDNPQESYEAGWKVRRPQLPSEVSVRYPNGWEYSLTPDGSAPPSSRR
ncbi:hypothetical protein [Streptomyces sp. NPDC007355]|uniref:hypothetical protein n=1 Tax=Streptomyces sp. NPDC007355 TaxID=3364778 RepID=UPI00367C40AC